MRKFFGSCLALATVLATTPMLRADKPANEGDRPQAKKRASASSPMRRLSQLSDFHLASWVILENDAQVRVSKFAQKNAESEGVKGFAQKMIDSHNDLIAELQAYIALTEKSGDEFDFGKVLQQVADRLARSEAEIFERVYRDGAAERRSDGRQSRREGEQAAREGETRENGEDRQTQDRGDRPRDEQRGDQSENDGEQQREQRREPLRIGDFGSEQENRLLTEVLPVLRDNLPQILDVLGETIKGTKAEDAGLAFIELKRQLSDKFSRSMIQEMKRGEKKRFDQAYLGFQIVAHLKMIDTMEVAQIHASSILSETLDRNIENLERHLQEARELMREID